MPLSPTALPNDPLQAFQALDTSALRALWCEQFSTAAAPGLRRELLIGALAHAQQVKAHGGLKTRIRRTLTDTVAHPDKPLHSSPTLASGTRLVREWQGQTYTVESSTHGYLWQGRQFASLSAVARAITGTRWSGPRFFGLDAGNAGYST
jgi:hypothetical protein